MRSTLQESAGEEALALPSLLSWLLCLLVKIKASLLSGVIVRNVITGFLLSNFVDAGIRGPIFTPAAPDSLSSSLSSKDQYRPRKPFVTQMQIFGCRST